jgi:hypothetical protein
MSREDSMTLKLEKENWHPYLDRLSKALVNARAEVKVNSPQTGSQTEAEWIPAIGVTYDPKNDIIDVALEGLDHLIQKPREVYVELAGHAVTNLDVVDGDGVQHVIKFKESLMLPHAGRG